MESKKTINLPEKTFDNKDLPKKKVYKKKNNKKLKQKSQYFRLVLIMVLLYKNGISKNYKFYWYNF